MKRFVLGFFVLCVFAVSAFSQSDSDLKTVEFLSPIIGDGKFSNQNPAKNCFNFMNESVDCRKVSDLYYGTMRSGEDWDWFQVMGAGSRNKIKNLGKKEWTDELKVSIVEPYPKLKEGERRLIFLDASGKDGEDGKPGLNGDGTTSPFSDVSNSERNDISPKREKLKSDYQPFIRAVKGNMYVLRVTDEQNDFYVLFRVDELERGKRCKISWKKIEAPKKS